jgi:hypothetical protein
VSRIANDLVCYSQREDNDRSRHGLPQGSAVPDIQFLAVHSLIDTPSETATTQAYSSIDHFLAPCGRKASWPRSSVIQLSWGHYWRGAFFELVDAKQTMAWPFCG